MNRRILGFGLAIVMSITLMGCASLSVNDFAQKFRTPQTFQLNSLAELQQAVSGQSLFDDMAVGFGDTLILPQGELNLGSEPLRIDVDGVNLIGNQTVINGDGILLLVGASDVTIDGVHLIGGDVGVQLERVEDVIIRNSVIQRNDIGILISGGFRQEIDSVEIVNNNISNNRLYGLMTPSFLDDDVVNAENNWWGNPSGPESDDNPNGHGDRIDGDVDFEPFLDAPAFQPDVEFLIRNVNMPFNAVKGQLVMLSADLLNPGIVEATADIQLEIIGEHFIERRWIERTLFGSTSMPLEFEVSFFMPGDYTINLIVNEAVVTQMVTVFDSF